MAKSEDLVQDIFGGAIRKAFPDASVVDLYGAGITFSGDKVFLTCGGETKEVALPAGETDTLLTQLCREPSDRLS